MTAEERAQFIYQWVSE